MPGAASTSLGWRCTAELDRPNLPLVVSSLALINFWLSG